MMPIRCRSVCVGLLAVAACGALSLKTLAQGPASPAGRVPVFEVDPTWPKLPNNWVLGTVSSIAVDSHDNVWIFHRPKSVPAAQKEHAAPAVVELDTNGKFVRAWGGPGDGFDWPDTEHGIFVDGKDNVWLTGSGVTAKPEPREDDMVLKFSTAGKFLKEIGGRTKSKGNYDTENLNRPADVFLYAKTNELFVGDGYGNRRVIVFDADSGKFKRMWGAFGNPPDNGPSGPSGAPTPELVAKLPVGTPERGSPQFGYRVHGLKISNDGLVYVCDRVIKRIQVFTVDGKYVAQAFINRDAPSFDGTASGLAFSGDPAQEFLYVADYGNSHIVVLNRKTLQVLYQFGMRTSKPGDLQSPHNMASDSKGNLYTAEVVPGNRAQKYLFKGVSSTLPPNALTAAQLADATGIAVR
jgi:hypothetical protein